MESKARLCRKTRFRDRLLLATLMVCIREGKKEVRERRSSSIHLLRFPGFARAVVVGA